MARFRTISARALPWEQARLVFSRQSLCTARQECGAALYRVAIPHAKAHTWPSPACD